MQEHWRARERYTVFDACYGDGSGVQRLIDTWRADPQRPARLHVIALAEGPMPGFYRIAHPGSNLGTISQKPGSEHDFEERLPENRALTPVFGKQSAEQLTLDLLVAPLEVALAQLMARLDFVRLHAVDGAGFARPLARLAAAGARLAATALTEQQAAALVAQGFAFESSEDGLLRAVFASRKPRPPVPPAPQRRAIVIGAGIAGSAACERLCARGWQVTLIERHARPAMEASGNHAGIFMPLVSRDDNVPTRLIRAAYLYAQSYLEGLGGVGRAIEGEACGVLQLARDPAHAQVQRAIAADGRYPPAFARWLEREAAEALAGVPAPDGGWLFPQGAWIRPGSVCEAMLAACGERLQPRFGAGSVTLRRADGEWQVADANGSVLAQAPTVVLANGTGALQLPQTAQLPLMAVRGQVAHVEASSLPALPVVLCREAYLTPPSRGISVAGATYDLDPDSTLRQSSHDDNLGKLRSLLSDPGAAAQAPLRGRVGFRCVAPDRLPLVGRVPDFDAAGATERLRDVPRHPGLYGLLGYASRGVTWAPLAAELLAAQIEGEPLPLEASLVDALDPARFVLRARRTSRAWKAPGSAPDQ